MKVNIATVDSGWILQKIANRIKENNTDPDVEFNVTHAPDFTVDINFYVDLQNCYYSYKTKTDIAYLTHADRNDPVWLGELMSSRNGYMLDGIVSMNKRYTDMVGSLGYNSEKLTTIVPGQTYDQFPLKKIVVGIVSRGGYPGYGHNFMELLFTTQNLENFYFRFLGRGWDSLIPIAQTKKISLELIDDIDYSVYPQFYQTIDYLLVPGLWTAGPMSMQEALSCGVPVIASDVGFVNYEFFADFVYTPGDINGLMTILNGLQEQLLKRRKQVENMSWSKYTTDLIKFFKKIKGQKND